LRGKKKEEGATFYGGFGKRERKRGKGASRKRNRWEHRPPSSYFDKKEGKLKGAASEWVLRCSWRRERSREKGGRKVVHFAVGKEKKKKKENCITPILTPVNKRKR